ncbi:MAG: ATP-binding cassette domain-containing protein [Pseudomonadota bacterium]
MTFDKVRIDRGSFRLSADFELPAGQKYAVIGPSGGGKSSLLYALAGFIDLGAGRVLWQGSDMAAQDPGVRPISMLFQDHNLFPHMTVLQNTGLGIRPNLRLSPAEWDRVHDALTQVGLQDQGDKKPGALSGGQRQRCALARVLLRDKPVLCLDEPFAALGPALRVEMLNLVDEIVTTSGATLLMVTHQPEDARQIADQTVLVADGTAAAPVKTATLFDNPPQALRDYIGDAC